MLYSYFSLQNIYISTLVVWQKGNLSKFCSLFLLYLAFSVSFWSGMKSHICVTPEGVCTDEFLSRKPGFLLSAMHSHTFGWFSAAPLVF
jgi:hypothetical protein